LLERSVQESRDIRIAYLDLGEILSQKKQYPEAIKAYARAAELDPTQPDAHFRLARMYQKTGQAEKAKAEFAKTQELHQKSDAAVVLQHGGAYARP
jgi:tetratricopeptide (TPR) repeat protein